MRYIVDRECLDQLRETKIEKKENIDTEWKRKNLK